MRAGHGGRALCRRRRRAQLAWRGADARSPPWPHHPRSERDADDRRVLPRAPARPVTPRLRALLFLVGAGAFALMVAHAGVPTILANIRAVGWLVVPIVLLYGVVQLFYAASWQTVMAAEPVSPPFLRTCAITVSTLALNFI